MSFKVLFTFFISSLFLSFILYSNTIKGGFVLDDSFFTDRVELRSAPYIPQLFFEPVLPFNVSSGIYRPLTYASFSLNYVLFGESPVSFHIVNVLLNGIVAFLVFVISFKLFKNIPLSICVFLLFSFFPIHSEVVANIKSRDELLGALFVFL